MAVVNEFDIKSFKYSPELRKAYVLGLDGFRGTFDYDICCPKINDLALKAVFFSMTKKTMLIVSVVAYSNASLNGQEARGAIMPFWIEDDLPVPSVELYVGLRQLLEKTIGEAFKEQYASYILDNIINS